MLESVAIRYPEKTFYLAQVFKDTTNSYKLVWYLSLLSVLKRGDRRSFGFADLLTEFAVVAWHPVCLYRLSLGRQDKLQTAILEIKQLSGLPPNAAPGAIRKFVAGSSAARAKLDYFKRYVPTRFLTPWFEDALRGMRDSQKDAKIRALATESQKTPVASLYFFETTRSGEAVRLNDSWRAFLTENLGLVLAFGDHHFALYLQARNPNVPGVVNKLRAPSARQLTAARDFWRLVHSEFTSAGKAADFKDIYTNHALGSSFSIDHFLPWSFVVHDLLWNLTPVEATTNSSKNDVLPDLGLYLPRLAKLQFGAIAVARKRPKFLEDYVDLFKQDPDSLIALGEEAFVRKYREVITPQAQIAINQGFQSGWKLRN